MANAMTETYEREGITVHIEGLDDLTYGVLLTADNGLRGPNAMDYEWDLEAWETIDEARDEAAAFIESLVNPY